MRLVFAGTPEAAVPSLRLLSTTAHEIAGVITRTDAPVGRKRVLTPSPVAAAAAELGIETIKTNRLDAAASVLIGELEPDLGVIVAYGGLVREPLLSTPRHGWINLHFSLLPKWRGAAPVQHALIAGDRVTGAAVFQLVAELDAGDVFAQHEFIVPDDATTADVLAALAEEGAHVLLEVIDRIASGTAVAVPQTGRVSLAPKLGDEDGRIDWSLPRDAVLSRVRGVTPEPGAHTTLDGGRLKVLVVRPATEDAPPLNPGELALHGRDVLAGTGSDPIVLERIQPAGKAPMRADDWWRGRRNLTDDTNVVTTLGADS